MGIRISKVLGYGLTDLKTEGKYNEIISDPRINPNGYFGNSVDKEEKFTDDGFDAYLDAHKEDPDEVENDLSILRHLRDVEKEKGREYRNQFFYRLIYVVEGGLPNVMVFQPPIFGNDWSRYDDTIDYYDPATQATDGGCGVDFVMLDRALYPFESFWDTRENPPKRLTGDDYHWYTDRRWSEKMAKLASENLGFKSVEEMNQCIQPVVPKELIALLKYFKVFTKDEYIYQLRPMIYWYWS